MTILDAINEWLSTSQPELERLNVTATTDRGPDDLPKRASWVDLSGPSGIARVTVWDSGEGEIALGDVTSGAVEIENRSFDDSSSVKNALDAVLSHVAR
jgi:hypothetical protein